ncbi:glycosyltransferase involved in cell wall biosynthesis [Variovorax sp. OAS795]|uniref:glycosyltransferase n=1 Tax=Variovorax sp. OAS795 TaxID=3034231 RepID=UPI0033961898
MYKYLFYDTIRLNSGAGGVLNVSDLLLRRMRLCKGDRIQPVSELHPRIFAAARRLRASRFLVEILLYNYHRLRALVTGEQVFSLFPNYFLPFTPFGRHRDSIVIVHDLQYKAYPEYFSRAKRLWLDWCLRRAARSQADVVFISRSSQQDFERYFRHCEHATVIFNPVDATRAPAPAASGATASALPADAKGAPDRYLIASYHYYPHKNFIGTLKLFERMKRAGLVDWLDITGNGAAEVQRMADAMGPEISRCVRHRGLVSRKELTQLYCGAAAFISLSAFEGFNLSAAEAATLGVPLLLSDIPVHRELFGGYAFLVGGDACDLGELSRYLAEHRETRPAWLHAEACAPGTVARRYLTLKREAVSLAGAVQ